MNLATGASSNIAAVGLAENLTTPVTYQWNLNAQYEFLPRWVLEIGYVGSHGIDQAATPLAGTGGGSGQAGGIPFNYARLVSPASPDPRTGVTVNTAGNTALRVPYLGIAPNASHFATEGSYKYNSLQATVRKQLSHGFQVQAAYTFSRAFTSFPIGVNTDPYLVWEYGLSPSYHPHRLVVNYLWNLPFGAQRGFVRSSSQRLDRVRCDYDSKRYTYLDH